MAIGIDCDEVLFPTIENFCLFLQEKYGYDISSHSFYTYDFSKVHGSIDRRISKDMWIKFNRTASFKEMKPLKGAVEGVAELSQVSDLYVVTSRPQRLEGITKEQIYDNFGDNFSGIIFASDNTREGRTKLEVCREEGLDILIEDDSTHIQQVSQELPVIAFPYGMPWNYNVETDPKNNIYRARTWKEVVEKTWSLHFNLNVN